MKKNGRPTARTELVVKKLEEAAVLGCTIEEMCLYAGITRATLYTWFKGDADLRVRLEELRDTPVLLARDTLCQAIKNGNADLALKYLERKRKAEFSTLQKIEHDGQIKSGIDLGNVDIDTLKKIRDMLKSSDNG